MSDYYFICNPASRSGNGIKIWRQVESYLKETKVSYEINFTKAHGDVENLVHSVCLEHVQEEKPVNIVILGGDGTLDEALQGVIDFSKTNIGYIPTGSGNDFARFYDYSDDPVENVKKILAIKEPQILDLGKLEYLDMTEDRSRLHKGEVPKTHWFDVSSGIGFDAAICEEVLESKGKNLLNKLGLGSLIYVLVAIKLLAGNKQPNAEVLLDDVDRVSIKKLRFVVGMNTCYEGGGYKFAPAAVPNDGYLDVCQINDLSFLGALMIIPKASKGKHTANKHVHLYHVKKFEVKTDIPLWVHTDGEVFTKSSHIRISVEPKMFRFLWS